MTAVSVEGAPSSSRGRSPASTGLAGDLVQDPAMPGWTCHLQSELISACGFSHLLIHFYCGKIHTT